jgi:hypothetical protein
VATSSAGDNERFSVLVRAQGFLDSLSAPTFPSSLSRPYLILPRVFVFVNCRINSFLRMSCVGVLSGLETVVFGVEGSFDGLTRAPGLSIRLLDNVASTIGLAGGDQKHRTRGQSPMAEPSLVF